MKNHRQLVDGHSSGKLETGPFWVCVRVETHAGIIGDTVGDRSFREVSWG